MISLNFMHKGLVSVVVEGDHATIEQEIRAALSAADQAIERNADGLSQPEPETTPPTTH